MASPKELIGLNGLAADIGIEVDIRLHTDSSAASGIATRRGIGKLKHLDTKTLWVQDQVERGIIKMRKVSGTDNPADILTKYLGSGVLHHHMF